MKKVKIYTTPTCPWCKKTKEFLKENNVEFEEKDISSDQDAQKEMIEKSGQMGVPVIDIEGEIVTGYDPDKLKELIGIEG
ncbi:NrdH-redoxin [Candidatus Woesearchaeota archaeon]|nr:NrdH-redoxin [Candidatus Woesearchaeota archaeon]